MGSFKLKLVAYFLLLSLLPILAAFWGFSSVAGQSETRRVDARLQSGLRSVLSSYQQRLDKAQSEANMLAQAPVFQEELRGRDLPSLVHWLRDAPNFSVTGADGLRVGHPPAFSAKQEVAVVTRDGLVGTVTAAVPFDTSLVGVLRARSGLSTTDVLVILRGSRIVASSPTVAGHLAAGAGQTRRVRVGDASYRALVAPALVDEASVRFAVLSPQSLIDAANSSSRERLLLGLLACIAFVSLVAYFEGRSIVRSLRALAEAAHGIALGRLSDRVPVRGRDEFALLGTAFNEMADQLEARLAELESERGRVRDAIGRFGDALSATHDVQQLLRVIVETAVEATGSTGARVLADDGRVVQSGDPGNDDGEVLVLPLTVGRATLGTLYLVGGSFDEEQRMNGASFASQAAIALENARLHRIVERQALVDGVTGIANRRQCEKLLTAEVARAERLGTPFTLVLADLDDFKAVNDRHGHIVGDDVLRGFASALRATIRDTDHAGRWGGEEFLILLPGADAAGGAQLADRVRAALAGRTFLAREGLVTVTCSIGVAEHRPGNDVRELVASADRALYRAKREGKNRVELDSGVRSF